MSQIALLLVDIQKGLDDWEYYGGERNNPQAEENAARLLRFWRQQQWPVFHVKHNSTNPASPLYKGKPSNDLKEAVQPIEGEMLIEKSVNNAFTSTQLQAILTKRGIHHLVVAGLTTEHCVSSTVRVGSNLGFRITLAHDATAAFAKKAMNGESIQAEMVHQVAIANLAKEFAKIVSTEQLLQELQANKSDDK